MATFEQAIEIWNKEKARREAVRLEEEKTALAESEQFVKEQFEKIELTPILIQGNHAYFHFQNEEIHFGLRRWKYGACGFYRVLGTCGRCGNQTLTDEYELTLENIGWVLSDPNTAYHECWVAPQDREPEPVKSNAERLVEVLIDLIDEKMEALNS